MAINRSSLSEERSPARQDRHPQAATVLILLEADSMAAVFAAYFEQEGYHVASARGNNEARHVYAQVQPDIVIIDHQSKQPGSYAFLYENNKPSNPAIFLLTDEVHLKRLQVLADLPDVEPVKRSVRPRELSRRVRAALHRAGKKAPEARIYQAGDVVIDRDRHFARIADRYVTLTPTEFDILSVLIASPNQVFTRVALRDRVLGAENQASERTIDVHVMNIRAKLGDKLQTHPYIETIHRVGYRFALDESTPNRN